MVEQAITALGVARSRFVEALERKSGDLSKAIEAVQAQPSSTRVQEELRRRMHALYASAQVFRLRALAAELKDAIARLDAAREHERELTEDEQRLFRDLAARLHRLAAEDPEPSAASESNEAASAKSGAPTKSSGDADSDRRAVASTQRGLAPGHFPSGGLPPAGLPPTRLGAPSAPPDPATGLPPSQGPRRTRDLIAPGLRDRVNTLRGASVLDAVGAAGQTLRGTAVESRAPSVSKPSAAAREVKPSAVAREVEPATVPGPTSERSTPPAHGTPGTTPSVQRRTLEGGVAAGLGAAAVRGAPTPVGVPEQPRPSGAPSGPPAIRSRGTGHPSQRRSETPAAGAPTTPRLGTMTRRVFNVLLFDDKARQTALAALLPAETYEVVTASEVEVALRLARATAPDVILADRPLALGSDFISRLRADAFAGTVPVILLSDTGKGAATAREAGAAALLTRPVEPTLLQAEVRRVTERPSFGTLGGALGDMTLDEVCVRMAAEIRSGLLDSAARGAELEIPLGDGVEVLAAAWAAVARVRAHVAHRSQGRVRFRDTTQQIGPALLALVDEDEPFPPPAGEIDLQGRRILVADDDPTVLSFFGSLLREQGALVIEADNGKHALQQALARRPDLVVSDVLMPGLDGLALCRVFQRDPVLSSVPVVLLSWKEDFLQRMRDLSSGASGYLRKEDGSSRVLRKLRELLRPRARLEQQLEAGAGVRGRVDNVGVVPLLRTVAAKRPNARLSVRDAWSLFEIDFRGAELVAVTRTATDGSFSRGQEALTALVGCGAGRFAVVDADGALRSMFPEGLETALAAAVLSVRSVVQAVGGRALSQARTTEFADGALQTYLSKSPERVRALVERIRQGEGPRSLLVDGSVSPTELASLMNDLARRGAVKAVHGPNGEDLIFAARQRLERVAAAAPTSSSSRASQTPDPAPSDKSGGPGASAAQAIPSEAAAVSEAVARTLSAPEQGAVATPLHASTQPESDGERNTWEPPMRRGFGPIVVGGLLAACAIAALVFWYSRPGEASSLTSMLQQETSAVLKKALPSVDSAPSLATVPAAVPAAVEQDPAIEIHTQSSETFDVERFRYGQLVEGISEKGIEVAPDEGLLVAREGAESGAEFRVTGVGGGNDFNQRPGKAPFALALPEGIYQISIVRAGRVDRRFIGVKRGHTRTIGSDN